MINFEYYKIFYYSAKYKNFTKAANVLQTSQSAISHAMKNLENELNCRLFARSNRGITLTPEGKTLYTYVAVGCEQFLKGESMLQESIQLENGNICIATTETALHCYLLDALKEFHKFFPHVRYKLLNCGTIDAVNAIKNGIADFAVVPSPFQLNSHMRKKDLLTFQDILICGEQFSELKGSEISIKDITAYPFICLDVNTTTRPFFEDLFQKHKTSLRVDMEAATSDMILPMAANNFGIGFIPQPLAQEALKAKEVFEVSLKETIPSRTISVIYDTEYPQSLAAKEFLRFLP